MLPVDNLSINRIILKSPYHQPSSIVEAIMRIEITKQYNRTILLNLQLTRGSPLGVIELRKSREQLLRESSSTESKL
jgi:hypothetical protein